MSETQAPAAAMDMAAVDPTATGTQGPAGGPGGGMRGTWSPSDSQKFDPRRKSPAVAAVLSVAPGVGQLYIGYYVRGFVIAAAFSLSAIVAGNISEEVAPFFGMTAAFLWVFNIIDAGRMAALYNLAAAGTEMIEMPEDFKLPKMGGSIVGGAVLLVFGAIALSNTAFGYSLDWLEEWWPVFPLALGLYLFARGVMEHMADRDKASARPFFDDRGTEEDSP